MREDIHYFTFRASEERVAAMRSPHLKARAAHLELARLYEEQIRALSGRAIKVRFDVAGAA